MKRTVVAATGLVVLMALGNEAQAKNLEEILKEKGAITEAEYKEATKGKPMSYKPGSGFTFSSPDEKFNLSLGGRLQTRYTFTDLEDNSKTGDLGRWENKRVRIWARGSAYSKDLTYLVNANFGATEANKNVLDAYFNYRFLDEVQIRAGQSKVPFGRQWLTSSAALQFVDRSIVTDAFRPGYDVGAKLHGEIAKGIVAYDLGVYGGAGWSTVRSSDDNALGARVVVNPLGKMAYSEADLDAGAKPLLSLGANYYRNTLKATFTAAVANDPATQANEAKAASTALETNNNNFAGSSGWLGKGLSTFISSEKLEIDSFGVDAAFKWQGAFAQAEYLAGRAEGAASGRLLRAHGFYAQAGYCIIPKAVELAMRYSYLDRNRDGANDTISETSGAVSWYISKHNLKLQGDISNSHDQGKGRSDDLIYRLQTTVVF